MEDLFIKLFGEGKDLTTLQICVRAFVMFFIALLLVRLGVILVAPVLALVIGGIVWAARRK